RLSKGLWLRKQSKGLSPGKQSNGLSPGKQSKGLSPGKLWLRKQSKGQSLRKQSKGRLPRKQSRGRSLRKQSKGQSLRKQSKGLLPGKQSEGVVSAGFSSRLAAMSAASLGHLYKKSNLLIERYPFPVQLRLGFYPSPEAPRFVTQHSQSIGPSSPAIHRCFCTKYASKRLSRCLEAA